MKQKEATEEFFHFLTNNKQFWNLQNEDDDDDDDNENENDMEDDEKDKKSKKSKKVSFPH